MAWGDQWGGLAIPQPNLPVAGPTFTSGGGGGSIPKAPQQPVVPPIATPPTLSKPAKPVNGQPIGQQQLATNPWSTSLINSAQTAGTQAGQQGTNNLGAADQLRTSTGQMLNTAFDPQNALYNRTLQQLQDQQRVGQAARGITMSPYGAGLENQALSNFNIDWQNNQLGRQTQGLQTAGQTYGQAGNIGQQGVGQTAQVGGMPYQAYEQNQQNDIANWLAYINAQNAQISGAQSGYPLQLQQQSFQNAGGVPYIPQSPTFNF
jgi:hypothetical protein